MKTQASITYSMLSQQSVRLTTSRWEMSGLFSNKAGKAIPPGSKNNQMTFSLVKPERLKPLMGGKGKKLM